MAFWTFSQNNTGGSFDFDLERGITHFTIVEAASIADAIERAEEIGIYFDGVAGGRDCPCCGDRWHEPYTDDASDFPEVYGQDVRKNGGFKNRWGGGWMVPGYEVCVHPEDGPLEWFGVIQDAEV